jgi:hypothetical protein
VGVLQVDPGRVKSFMKGSVWTLNRLVDVWWEFAHAAEAILVPCRHVEAEGGFVHLADW